jgi:hypothetical protein
MLTSTNDPCFSLARFEAAEYAEKTKNESLARAGSYILAFLRFLCELCGLRERQWSLFFLGSFDKKRPNPAADQGLVQNGKICARLKTIEKIE